MEKENRADFYENHDFSDLIKEGKGKIKGTVKRITINISDTIYDEANELDTYMQTGYQNVLKTAMTIGLTELYNQVSQHKIKKTKKSRAPSWHSRLKKPAKRKQPSHRTTGQ